MMMEPWILDDNNNCCTITTADGERKRILVPPTDHVLCSIWYQAALVQGGSINVHLYLCRPSELNKKFGIPLFCGTFQRPYDQQAKEIDPVRAEFLINTVIAAFMKKNKK